MSELSANLKRLGAPRHEWRIPISSQVVPGLAVALDSAAIFSVGAILYAELIFHTLEVFGIYSAIICFVWVLTLLIFHFSGLYRFEALLNPKRHIDHIAIALSASFLFLLAAAFSFKITATISRLWVAAFAIGTLIAMVLVRLALANLVHHFAGQGVFRRNTIIVGDGEQVVRLVERIQQLRPHFLRLTGIFTGELLRSEIGGVRVLGGVKDVTEFLRRSSVEDVVIAMPWSAEDRILSVVNQLRELPVNIYLGSDLAGLRLDLREPPSHYEGIPIATVSSRPLAGWGAMIKALEDYAIAFLALIFLSPLMALIAGVIKLDSPGPVLFRQKRLGFNNREFEIYKFRSMRHEPASAEQTIQATRRDPRITAVGQFLRRTSLDELPQLFNVLNGTMSLVGPRPHAVDHNALFARQIRGYFARHRVKPGMTGWAQVNGYRGETNTPGKIEGRVRHDVFYAENWSLWFDLKIMVMTVIVLATGRDAY